MKDIKKIIINNAFILFGIVMISIFILLLFYYFTPNNFVLYEDYNKFKFEKVKEFNIKSNSIELISNKFDNDYYLQFITFNTINLIIKNTFKSQNITIMNKDLIKSRYNSDIFFINNSDFDIKIYVNFYSKRYL